VPGTLDAFAHGDANCWSSLASYWVAGLTALGGVRVAQMAAQSKPFGLLAEVSHSHTVMQVGLAKVALGVPFIGLGPHQSARCGR